MIADMGTNSKNLNKETYAIMERMVIQAQELEKVIKEQSSRQLPSDITNDDIRESERISLSLGINTCLFAQVHVSPQVI